MPARAESLAAVVIVFCPGCNVTTGFRRTYFWALCEGWYGETRCCGTTLRVPERAA